MSSSVAVNDLTNEVTSEEYWKILAKSRSQAIDETSLENHDLRKYIALLDEKLNQQRAELAQARLEVSTLEKFWKRRPGGDCLLIDYQTNAAACFRHQE